MVSIDIKMLFVNDLQWLDSSPLINLPAVSGPETNRDNPASQQTEHPKDKLVHLPLQNEEGIKLPSCINLFKAQHAEKMIGDKLAH